MKNSVLAAITLVLFPTAVIAQPLSPAQPVSSPTIAPSSAPSITVAVPGGTSVFVNFPTELSSDSATEGQTVPVVASKDVVVNGYLIIAKGAQGQATLTKVVHSAGNGSGGQIKFNVDWINIVDGGKIALSPVNNTTENADRKGEASTLAIAGWATFGVLGLFSHNMARGNAAVLKPDKLFTVFIDHDVHVAATEKASAPGFDQ